MISYVDYRVLSALKGVIIHVIIYVIIYDVLCQVCVMCNRTDDSLTVKLTTLAFTINVYYVYYWQWIFGSNAATCNSACIQRIIQVLIAIIVSASVMWIFWIVWKFIERILAVNENVRACDAWQKQTTCILSLNLRMSLATEK